MPKRPAQPPAQRPAGRLRRADLLAIGDVARRSGIAPSALRHYERLGLIASERTAGGHRAFRRDVLRRLSVIRAGQRVGLSLDEIGTSFGSLDPHDAPTRQQWRLISKRWAPMLDAKITELQQVRDNLAFCVGCGCLSMRQCSLYNPEDTLGEGGASGAQRLLPGAPDA